MAHSIWEHCSYWGVQRKPITKQLVCHLGAFPSNLTKQEAGICWEWKKPWMWRQHTRRGGKSSECKACCSIVPKCPPCWDCLWTKAIRKDSKSLDGARTTFQARLCFFTCKICLKINAILYQGCICLVVILTVWILARFNVPLEFLIGFYLPFFNNFFEVVMVIEHKKGAAARLLIATWDASECYWDVHKSV